MNGLQDNENIWHKRSGFEQFSLNIIHKQGWFCLRRKTLTYHIYIETFTAHYLSFIGISDEWRSRIPFLRVTPTESKLMFMFLARAFFCRSIA